MVDDNRTVETVVYGELQKLQEAERSLCRV